MRYPRATRNVAAPAATSTKLRSIYVIIFVAVAIIGVSILLFKASPSVESKQMTMVYAANRGGAYVNLKDGKALRVSKFDGPQDAADALRTGAASARSLTRADFDGNGTPDVVAGYALNNTGLITVHQGNPEAYAPTDDSIYTRIQQGYNPEPLLPQAKVYQLPEPVDFLAAGDFNRDSEKDILAGSRNGSLFLLARKDGVFEWPVAVSLPGALTALTTGEFRAADGKTDIAIAVNGFNGPQVLVYDGHEGLNGEPMIFQLSAPGLAVEFGELDSDPFMDLSVVAGNEAVFIHGWGRKRNVNPQLQVEKLELGFQARGMALGFFVWNRDAKKQVAILGDNGTTQIFHSGELRAQPFNEQELAERGKARLRPKRTDEDVELVVGWQPSAKKGWDAAREFHTNTDTSAPGNRLFKAHLSGAEIDNLMFMDSRSQVKVVQQFSQKYAPESVSIQGTTDISEASLSLVGQPTAILAMPPKINGQRSLIMLQSGTPDLATVPDNVVVASSVDRFDDPDPATASACTGAAGDCSLRGAIQRANANATDPTNPAANVITLPNGTYTLTRNGAGGCVNGDNNSTGDLEINNSTTITGGGMLTTVILQTGTGSGAFLGDRVMCLNTALAVNRDYVFSGFTIAGGFDRSQIGGGGLVGGAKDNFLSLANIRITNNDNTAAANYSGGGLSITGGDVTITNSLIGGPTAADGNPAVTNDRTDLTRGNYAGTAGGGIGYSPGDPIVQLPSVGTLTVTGTTVQGNKANSGATGGGGLDLFQHNSGTGSFIINGNSIIDSNSALNGNGGGVIIESGPLTVDSSTFTNNSTVLANTRGGAIYLGGGGMSFGSSTSFSNNTVGAGVVLGKCISVNTGGSASTGVFVTGGNNNINDNVEILPNGVWTNNAGTSVTFLNLTLAEGTFVGNNSTLTINQDLNLNSFATADTPVFTGGSGTHTITGNLNIVEGTYTATSGTTNVAGNFNQTGGTFTHNSGTFIFNGAGAQTISGTPTFNILTVNKGGGALTLLSNIGVASNLNLSAGTFDLQGFTANRTAAGGTMTLANGTLLKIGGTNGLPANYTTHSIGSTSTVEYSGTNQTVTVPNSVQSYGNLMTSGSGTKTLGGNISVAGNVTIGSGTVLAGGGNTLNVGGNWVNNVGNLGFTSTGFVNFNGGGAQSLTGATTFNHLVIGKTAGQTLTLNSPIIVGASLLLSSGNLTAGSNAISVGANWTNNSGASAFSGTNTTTFTGGNANTVGGSASTAFGSLTVNKSGGTLSLLTNITISGDLTVTAGTFDLSTFTANRTAAGGTLSVSNGAVVTVGGTNALPSNFNTNTFGATSITNFTGTNQNVAGITYGHLNLSGAGTKTLLGPATIAGSLTIASGTTFDSASNNIDIGGNWTNNGGTFLPGTGTVSFNSITAAQGITGTATTQTFNSITVNKTGQLLNVAGSTTALDINGNVILTAGTFDAGTAATINVAGNWTNNGGTFTAGTGTVIFDGGAGQTIGGTNATTFNNLTNSNGDAGGLAMSHDNTVNAILALSSSDITVAATKTLTMPGTGSSSGNFDVVGSVKRTGFALNVPLSFGNPFNTIEVDSGALPTDIVVNLVKAAPASFTSAVNRTYTITPNGGSPNATLRLHYRDSELNGNIESQLDLWRFNNVAFVDEQRTDANTTDNWVEKSGVTAFSPWTLATHVNLAPSITPNPAATIVGVQTAAIVLDRQVIDAAFVTHFKITSITNGTLFKSDGVTQINNNDFISYAEGTAGVKFTPSPNSVATGSFTVQASSDAIGTGLSTGTTGTINVNQGTTTTTITLDNPDPSTSGQIVTVNYSVVAATGIGTPSGNVVVTVSGGAETCTATVADGTCDITLTVLGNRTLTATYAGDANFTGDDDTETHDVVGPPDAVDDSYSTFKDTVLNIPVPGVLTNDTGSPTVSAVGGCADVTTPFQNCATTAGGLVTVNADGSFSYTPLTGYVGADSFTYTATNGGGSDSATVNITVSDSLFLNEILFDPPGVDAPNEYIELRSMASATIPAGTYLVVVDGDSANAGDVTTIINLTGLQFGSNGFLVLLQNGNTYTTAAGATVVTSGAPGFSGLPGGIWQADGGATDLQNDAASYMLIQTNVPPALVNDIDADNNGSPEAAVFTGWNVLDSINVMDGSALARAYGAFGYRNVGGSGTSQGTEVIVNFLVSYVGRSGDTTGSTATDWVAAGPLNGAAPNWLLPAEVSQPQFVNQPLNHIGTTNFDITAPTVQSIVRADANPTNAASVDFTVTFSESVTGVDVTDFALTTTGTASATINSVTGGPTTWNVALTSVTGDGTIRLDLTDDDSIKDGANNPIGGAGAQNFTTGEIYDVDHTAPTVDITDVTPDPRGTSVSTISIVFDEEISGFNLADLTLTRNGGSNLLTGAQTLTSGDNITWTLGNLSGITGTDGSYVLTLTAAGAGITDGVGNALAADAGDSWVKDASVPSVDITDVTPDPRTTSVSSILIVFSEAVTGFDLADLDLTRDGGADLLTGAQTLTSGDNITWTLGNLSGLTGTDGTYLLTLTAAGSGIVDGGGNALSNSATDTWVKDSTGPSVTINQAVGQADPTSTSPINFTVVFNEAVTNFVNADVSLSGTAGATTAVVTEIAPNNDTTYNVAVSGMTSSGTVIASLAAGVASDALGNLSQASMSTDNTVQFNLIINVAPVLDNTGNMTLSAINEDVADASNPGTLVSAIIASAGGDRITDADAGALEGIAVIAANNANGTWQYSINNGTNWTAFGSPDATTARLLAADVNTRVRFVPNANFNGTVTPGITFRAWDQSTGANGGTADVSVNGGNTAFSTATETADITVNAVNDAPTANAQAVVTNEDAPVGITLSGSDVETAAGSLAFTVTVQPTNGVLSGTAPNLTYTPNANFNGADSFKFTVTDTGDGASTALTSTEAIVSITVDAVNDAPVNTVPGAQSTATNDPLTFSAGNSNLISIADIDAGTNAVQVTLTATNGTISLSGTGGLVFSVGDGTADATMTFTGTIANINSALNGLVFTPTGGFNGAASLQIITNDQGNTGSGGARSDTDTVNITVSAGGTLQFSGATYTVAENGGPATITITRSGGTVGAATVLFETSHGTAGAGDYTTVSQTVTFVDGDTSETVNVPITNDSLNEPDETVNLTLSNAGGSGTLGTPAAAVLTITNDDTPTISFSAATYAVAEDGLHIDITVNRTGDASAAASVDYATSDLSGLADCATINGNASSRCDYLPALGTLNFAAAQTSRTFRVFVSDDVRAEGAEVLTLTLSGPAGGVLGATNTATLTINDHVVAPGSPNPIDDPAFFIRMLYVDILSREPDTIGFANWLATINGCPDGGFGNVNTTCDRVHVAKSFFHSAEFGMRGYFIYRFFNAGLGQRPTYQKFLRGMQQIGGSLSPADSDAAKMEFVEDFIASAEFQAIYTGLLVPAQANAFITKLEQTSGITIPEPTRSQLVADMASSAKTPAETLRAFMETQAVFDGFYNRGFVSMLYFGYLHRDPDTIGFDNWLTTLNATGDYRHLTFGFIYSTEYRSRFGTP